MRPHSQILLHSPPSQSLLWDRQDQRVREAPKRLVGVKKVKRKPVFAAHIAHRAYVAAGSLPGKGSRNGHCLTTGRLGRASADLPGRQGGMAGHW